MKNYSVCKDFGAVPYRDWKNTGIAVPIFSIDNAIDDGASLEPTTQIIESLAAAQLPDIYSDIAFVSNSHDNASVLNFTDDIRKKLGISVLSVSRADGYKSKPHPEMGFVIAREFNVERSALGVVGNHSNSNMEFGKNIGAGAIALCLQPNVIDDTRAPSVQSIDLDVITGNAIPSDQEFGHTFQEKPQAIGRKLFDVIQRVQKSKRDNGSERQGE
ncbi:MAG: hypothetical protein EOO17_04430 [Chloroflexi bacterium]|nr:MAG: hypothetical protein EOO17_04430 [Chloroflexota bacterium]